MFCSKCGKQVPDGAKFCNGCGNPLVKPEVPKHVEEPRKPEKPKKPDIPEETDKPAKSKKGWIILAVVMLILAALAAGWILVGKDWVEETFFAGESSKEADEDSDMDEEEEPSGDAEEVDIDKIIKKYNRYMTRTYGEDTNGMTFYLTEDEIPEFLVYIKGAQGDFIAILQYRDSKVEEVVAASKVAGIQYIEQKGKFLIETNQADGTAATLYEVTEGEAGCTEIGSCAVTSQGYRIENALATEAEYQKYIRRYEILDERIGTRVQPSTKDYVLPDSSTRYLTKADLEGLTKDECRIARNEIYARYGRKFNDEALQAYFNTKSWYKPTMEADAFKEDMLNKYEVANRDLIVEYEKEKGFR